MGRLIFYIVATSYLRRGRRDVKLRDQDVLRKLFAEWVVYEIANLRAIGQSLLAIL